MATRIKLKRSTTALAVPTTSNLEDGEVALNIADKKLYARNGSNIIEVANQKPNTGEVVTTMLSSDITNGQGNTYYVATVGSDTSTLANGGAAGKHPDTPFLTITKALTTATSGDTIIVAPGEYQEAFPMTVPDGVTLRGTNLRSTSVKPTGATNTNTAFILSGDCHVSDMTIKEFFYDSGNDDGYAFEVVSNMNSTQSPYIERVTVTTKGSVVSGSDPYGFAQGDAGRGAKLDGANLASGSQHGSVLFNECTFITPNQIGVKATNGIRVEWLNCFNYFASIGIQGIQGATGKYGTGSTRLKLGGTSGTFSTSEVTYQLEDSFQSGSYARSGSTITLTRTGHGLVTGDYIYADHISGGATDGFYQVTLVDANNVTYTNGSGTISTSNVTYKKAVARGVVASNDGTYVYITGKGTGVFLTATKPAKGLTRFGDSQISTAQKKFGTGSILLDGTEDNVKVPTSDDFGFGTSNWCLEAFIRPSAVSGIQHIFDLRDGSGTDTAPKLYLNGTTLHFGVGNSSVRSGGTLSTNTWYHVAVARNGGTTKLFLDGVELGTGADTNDYGTTKPVVIGSDYQASPTEAFNGYIDEVRISKGAARFTGAFTPTTSEYSSDLNTVLLLHANGDDASTTFTDTSGGTSDIRSNNGDSASSVITADYSAFGCEVRSVASACIYGTKGIQADGAGTKLIMTSHNFGYVGAGADYTNDPSLAVQNNEVEELNDGKVLFSSTDQNGDFRVGDAFSVDVSTGSVQFQATSTAQSAANITLSDGTGTTNIFPAYIETGNLRLAGNSITSTTGQVIVDPSGQEDFVVNAETIVKEAVYFDVNKSISFGSVIQGALNIAGFNGSTVFGSSEAANFSTRSFVVFKNELATINVDSAGSGYEGGQQSTAASSNPFQVGTATAALNATGAIKSVTITNRGSGYTIGPAVAFSAGDATGTADLTNAGKVVAAAVDFGGSNYAGPSATVAEPPQNTFAADSVVVNTTTNRITISNHNFETGDQATFDATQLDATAVAPTGLTDGSTYYMIYVDINTVQVAANLSDANAGNAINLTASGSGSMFFQGVTAAVTVTQSGGVVDGVTITNAGTGYESAPVVTITDSGAGSGANVSLTMGYSVGGVTMTAGGEYTAATVPTVSFTNDQNDTTGSGVAGTAVIGFPIETITLNDVGLGYRNVPTVLITGGVPAGDAPTTEAQATVTLEEKTGRLGTLTLDNVGEGYITTPTVTLDGGGGKDAVLQVDIQSLTGNVTSTGSGYTAGSYANVEFTGGSPTVTATATFLVPGFATTISNAGSGYTDGTYQINLYNTPTQTFTVTVVQRTKLTYTSTSGTFQVGDVVTGSVSGAQGTITIVDPSGAYFYMDNVTGTFLDGQQENATGGTSNAVGVIDVLGENTDRYMINGVEAGAVTLTDGNTYKFDQSDSSNTNHPMRINPAITGVDTRIQGTPGSTGAYFEVIVGAGTSSTNTTGIYDCQTHGSGMSEPTPNITFQSGAAGVAGTQMTANVTVASGSVTLVELLTQGTGYALNDTLFLEDTDVGGGGGSGFLLTLTSESTGITAVSGISLGGAGYQVGDVLSVDDSTVGGGGGSGFQYTVTDVGFCNAVTVTSGGTAFEQADTLVLGAIGGEQAVQGSGLQLSIASINSKKNFEVDQDGQMTIGDALGTYTRITTDGVLTAVNWSVSQAGVASLKGAVVAGNGSFTGTLAVTSTSTFTGLATCNGGVTVTGGPSSIEQLTAKFADGTASQPSISFDNSNTSGLFQSAVGQIGFSLGGVHVGNLSTNEGFDFTKLQVDSTIGSLTPFFKVDTGNNKLEIGPAAQKLYIDNTNTIGSDGTDINVPINFSTKGQGNFVFKGGTNVDFSVTDGTTEKVRIETQSGDTFFSGNLNAGLIQILDNTINNNSTTATRSFGHVLAVNVTGVGSGYTDGTYTATATSSTGDGTGLTLTLTVSGGDFSAVTIVDIGQNYRVDDTVTIAAIGGGSGKTITITDVDGGGISIKPNVGLDVLCDTTGSLVVPAGTTNERPNVLDRKPGAIRYNTTQLQFEGFNGQDFVSLGGVRDVDQDTYILTESSPGSDEDTFEFFAEGENHLAINKNTMTFKGNMSSIVYPDTAFLHTIPNSFNIDGTSFNINPLNVKSSGSTIVSVRNKKDFEVTGGLRFRNVPAQGVVATLEAASLTQVATSYTPSTTVTSATTSAQIEGSGLTVDITTDANGTVTTVAVNNGGTNYEVGEVITIAGTAVGGLTPDQDITIKVETISGASSPISRNDVLRQNYTTRLDSKPFIDLDANGSEAGWKINRGWNGGSTSYLTIFDSTADFVELDDCRVEGGTFGPMTQTATIVQFDKTQYKGAKTLITIESNDGKVHMFEVTAICAAAGTAAHATITNSITSDNDLMDATIAVAGNSVNIQLTRSPAATSTTSYTGRFTTTKVKV